MNHLNPGVKMQTRMGGERMATIQWPYISYAKAGIELILEANKAMILNNAER